MPYIHIFLSFFNVKHIMEPLLIGAISVFVFIVLYMLILFVYLSLLKDDSTITNNTSSTNTTSSSSTDERTRIYNFWTYTRGS